ncbi:type I-MYXAN CRISPR-associated Cas8a1/Cmx1 [Pseudanabaena sp. UWO310]|uniref:type I-MYXAN CRISPR-associated Cas8a1/Cmx1 n=1 Tax=Pseudanabaena sp. UWO310 TaxID=2480795 RepID=UPI0011611D4D|nr:type I-MYXAN CRISPR-associated Cas8a1/Cmx1 [Pseudanabaena sp. UWO310]TYQ24149.1 type I-MYXAN CRISPR-associated Cas8a1/Cmx1 [Pseudanabaena sp. UWO310]
MSRFELSIFDPNTLLPHRAGIAGLALVLSTLEINDAPISWETDEDTVTLNWDCSDKEAIDWLVNQAYQIDEGMLNVPALNLSGQGKFTFSQGVTSTFLQHSKQRTLDKTPILIPFKVDENQPEILVSHRSMIDCYYLRDFKGVFNSKNKFSSSISIKGHHLPGLVECYINGEYEESPSGFIPLLFLPIACNYYLLQNGRYALVIPEVKNLKSWVCRRRQLSNRSYRDYRSPSAGEAALRLLLEESLSENLQLQKVEYCEVYQLGKQPWDGNQSGLKQAVYRVRASSQILSVYQSAIEFFPSKVKITDKGESWLAMSKILPWIAENLVNGKPWHGKFYEFRKSNANDLKYERKGLISMTDHLQTQEKTLFDSVQGAFSVYLVGQIKQATKQGRPLDYAQVTDKVIHRLQRPSTQQEFATALVDFLSQFRSKAARGLGREIYAWIHGEEWRKARDLTMLAIATYQSKKKESAAESNPDLVEIPDSVDDEVDGYQEEL